jgi:hypothetical protein
MAAVPGEVATPRWPDPWAFLAQLPVSRQLGLDRTMWVLLTVAVLFIGVVMAVLVDSRNAVVQVQDFLFATSQIAQTTLRSVLGQVELDDLLASPNKINQQLQRIIDEHTGPWGVKVTTVEVKQVDLPQDMQRAMSQRAEAEQERWANRGGVPGDGEARAGRPSPGRHPDRRPAPLSADDAGGGLGTEHDHLLPRAHRSL